MGDDSHISDSSKHLSPWEPLPTEFYWTYTLLGWVWDPKYEDVGMTSDEFWYNTLVDKTSPYYNPFLVTDMSSGAQYLSRLTNVWDSAYLDAGLGQACGAYYRFYDRIGNAMIKDVWGEILPLVPGMSMAPMKYACCSPLRADSDCDGMDDYYELFHGMNPLLGKSGVKLSTASPCDLVYDAWATDAGALEAWGIGATANFWQQNPWKTPRGNEYDFEVFPWLNGIVDADPDGDVVPNQTEAMMPKLNTNSLHTDPTPLWMTDSSYAGSIVHRFFRMQARFDDAFPSGDTFTYNDETYQFCDFDCWVPAAGFTPAHYAPFTPDYWGLLDS